MIIALIFFLRWAQLGGSLRHKDSGRGSVREKFRTDCGGGGDKMESEWSGRLLRRELCGAAGGVGRPFDTASSCVSEDNSRWTTRTGQFACVAGIESPAGKQRK